MSIDRILDILLSLVAVFTAIVFHEVAHGYVAARLGDPTAKSRGRLTMNPLAHVDPIGTILVPVTLAILRLPLFGWAKPVPINPNYFRNPFRGMLYVALAGPGTNVGLALVTAGVGRLVLLGIPDGVLFGNGTFAPNLIRAVFLLLGAFVIYNFILAVFNMIPIPPLDGSRVLTYFLPVEGKRVMLSLERYGFVILIAVIYLGGVSALFRWIAPLWQGLLGGRWMVALRIIG